MLISVLIDSREPGGIQRLPFGGVEKAVVPLDYPDSGGSYDLLGLCDDGQAIAVERATPNDFLRKIRDNRLFPQLAQLRQVSPWAYLVIAGEIRPAANDRAWIVSDDGVDQQTGWAWSSVQGALLTAQEIGVHVVTCASVLDYEQTVMRLGNRDRSIVRVPPARDIEMLTDQEALLASLPGVGRERAAALLAHCGTPATAIDWLTGNATSRVPGVGPETRRRVRRALGLGETEWLAVETVCDPVSGEVLTIKEVAETEEVAA